MSEILDERIGFYADAVAGRRVWIHDFKPKGNVIWISFENSNRYGEPGPAPIGVEI